METTTSSLDELRVRPNALARHYSAFRVDERLLLTGHSHQAWPDVAFEGQKEAWLDAAEHADGKWDSVAHKVERVSEGYRTLMGGCAGDMTLDTNTHSLVVRFLSALPLRERPRIVTTDGEFHTIRRQLDRLVEEGLEVVKVPAKPVHTLAERVAEEVDDRTAAAMISSVLFTTGLVVPHLDAVARACERQGAEMLVDSYHSLGVVPFSLEGMERAFVVGGGYKYLQLGEGNCALRVPPDCTLRPAVTGWFSEFAELADERVPGRVAYGTGPARFAGSTYDPTSAYRGAAVLDFFVEQGLTADFLRTVSLHQVGLLERTFLKLALDPATIRLESEVDADARGGFLALTADDAGGLFDRLLQRGVRTDYRGDVLRFGPAPYHCDEQLVEAISMLGEVVDG
ncbi:MAG: aminotransferase class V-fold PLP-dependent enzyme [Gemmatimonadetes bacterium]|nr:aminotransferase class V-fold PLP-dependent enzyme [Gemmatimonadota bacterium]NNF14362.1 aminotransferase class V-fold PLP-dependent enzyme [Gemmatimonadota bacterium]NNL29708.1 aminotransferase class V-fold PLP-dependent enzyme [Gemmatimonadota bacterium]